MVCGAGVQDDPAGGRPLAELPEAAHPAARVQRRLPAAAAQQRRHREAAAARPPGRHESDV